MENRRNAASGLCDAGVCFRVRSSVQRKFPKFAEDFHRKGTVSMSKGFLSYEQQFMQRTLSIYRNMQVRFAERRNAKGQVTRVGREIPFSIGEFRTKVESVFGPRGANPAQCRYCTGWITIAEMASDHAVPIARGGSLELDNIEFPCADCNDRKGKLLPAEYTALYNALQAWPDAARRDVLGRLQMAVKLAAKQRADIAKRLKKSTPQQEETEQ